MCQPRGFIDHDGDMIAKIGVTTQPGKKHIAIPTTGVTHTKKRGVMHGIMTHGTMEPMLVIGPHQIGLITLDGVGATIA